MEMTIIVALVIGLTQVLKKGFSMQDRFVPLLSVGIGLVLAIVTKGELGWDAVLTVGLIAGLSASGLYDVAHKTILNK